MTAQARKTISVWGAILALGAGIVTLGSALGYVAPILALPSTVSGHTAEIQESRREVIELKTALAVTREQLDTLGKGQAFTNEQLKLTNEQLVEVLRYLRK